MLSVKKAYVILGLSALAAISIAALLTLGRGIFWSNSTEADGNVFKYDTPILHPDVSVNDLLQLCAESHCCLAREAAINTALRLLTFFAVESYHTVLDEKGSEGMETNEYETLERKTMLKLMMEKGEERCQIASSDLTFKFFFTDGPRFLKREYTNDELDFVRSNGLNVSFYDDMIAYNMHILREGSACALPLEGEPVEYCSPLDWNSGRQYTVNQIKRLEEWEAPYVRWFYDLLLYYAGMGEKPSQL